MPLLSAVPAAALPLLGAALYVLWTFLALLVRQARSPLRHLRGPPSPSFLVGNLREMHDQENTALFARWEHRYGSTFVYHGFLGGARLLTTDPVAVAHILAHGYDFPKPEFIRDALASMAAGHEGLLVVEGEDHRRQRKILSPAFATPHIKSLSPIIWSKATQLRDVWIDLASSPSLTPAATPSDPLAHAEEQPARASGFLPNPFSSFLSSKAHPRSALPRAEAHPEDRMSSPGTKVDVLAWLARATLDVIGEAGACPIPDIPTRPRTAPLTGPPAGRLWLRVQLGPCRSVPGRRRGGRARTRVRGHLQHGAQVPADHGPAGVVPVPAAFSPEQRGGRPRARDDAPDRPRAHCGAQAAGPGRQGACLTRSDGWKGPVDGHDKIKPQL